MEEMEEAFSKEDSPSLTTLATLAYNISSSSCLEATDEEAGGRRWEIVESSLMNQPLAAPHALITLPVFL